MLYLGSSIFLILFIAISFYRFESISLVNQKKEQMQNLALKISSDIINSYMHSMPLEVLKVDGYSIVLLGSDKRVIYGDNDITNLKEGFYEDEYFYYFVDLSARLHHGVKYIVLKSTKDMPKQKQLMQSILFFSLFSITIIAIVGYFLSKMFLKPIQNERLKLDKFIKDSTHELNTPITAILMSIERLKAQNIDEKILERVRISSKRVQKLYLDLVYLMLEDAPEPKMLDLKNVIEKELLLYEDIIAKKSLLLTKELNSFNYKIDELSAQRLFSNLISNAIKYSPKNQKIELLLRDAKFSIKNYGVEIKEEHFEVIFNRYHRLNHYESGFGIGLDIVKRVIERYDIKIKVDSKQMQTTIELLF